MRKERKTTDQGPPHAAVKRSGAADAVFRVLHESILSGKLKPGERLPSQDRLARQFDVSRNTLREAVHKLTAMGLLSPRQGVGTVVNAGSPASFITTLSDQLLLNPAAVQDFLEARIFVERATVRMAAKRARSDDLAKLRDILARQKEALEKRDTLEFSQLDTEFHIGLGRASGNHVLTKFVEIIRDLLGRFILEVARLPAAKEAAVDFHREILSLVAKGEPEQAEDAIRRHLLDVVQRIEKYLPIELDAASLKDLSGLRCSQAGNGFGPPVGSPVGKLEGDCRSGPLEPI